MEKNIRKQIRTILTESYVSPIGQYIEEDYTPDELKALRSELLKAVHSHKNSKRFERHVDSWYEPHSGFDNLSSTLVETFGLMLASKKVGLDSEFIIPSTLHHMVSAVIVSTTEGKYIVTIDPKSLFVYDEEGYIQGINRDHEPAEEDILMYPFGKPPQEKDREA